MDGVTPTGSEIKDNYPMVTTSSAGVQTVGHQLHACQRVGIAWWEEVCSTVVGVGTPLKDMSGARVLLTAPGLEVGIFARASGCIHQNSNSDREYWAQTIQTRNVQHRWRSQMHLRAR